MGLDQKTGLAMYTVHRAVEKDMRSTFTELSDMGYRGIEFYGEPEHFLEEKVRDALCASGMEIVGWHLDWKRFHEESFGNTVRRLRDCGCKLAVVQCLGGKWNVGHDQGEECKDRWLYYIEWLNHVNERMKGEGMRLAYHNHGHEFELRYDGKTVFDILYENLSPDIVMELDSGNCMEGGGDPVSVLEKYRNRRIMLHLKPYSRQKGFDVVLGEEPDENDWNAMLHQPQTEFEWLLVESENESLPEMENAARCIHNLRRYFSFPQEGFTPKRTGNSEDRKRRGGGK